VGQINGIKLKIKTLKYDYNNITIRSVPLLVAPRGPDLSVVLRELLETTCRLANSLKSHGVLKGDRVALYMPGSPLAVAAMLACARIGAVHAVVFAGFSAEASRIQDGEYRPPRELQTARGPLEELQTARGATDR